MDPTNGRNENGQFIKGYSGGPGRPPRETEQSYLRKLHEVCSLDDWQTICKRAVADAAAGDRHARRWLSAYLLPRVDKNLVLKPAEPVDAAELLRTVRARLDAYDPGWSNPSP